MGVNLRNLCLYNSAPYGTAPAKVNFYSYADTVAVATLLTAGFFNDARDKVKVNDVVDALCVADGVGDLVRIKFTAVPAAGGGDVTVATDDAMTGNRAVVATVGGLTTGLVLPGDTRLDITSANADYIVTLPAIASVPFNHVIRGYIAATGCELRTPDASGTKINNVDADGTQEMALPANSIFVATKHATDNWIVEVYVAAGTRTIPTPD